MRPPGKLFLVLVCVALLASGCSGGRSVETLRTLRTTTTPPGPPPVNASLPCPDLTNFLRVPEADRTAYLTTGVPCDRPELWLLMGFQLLRQRIDPACGYGTNPPALIARDEETAERLRKQLPSNIRDEFEIEIGCAEETAGTHSNEPGLGNEDANTIAREMLDIDAKLGVVGGWGVAANPDGSIYACVADEAMANETEKRAKELGIEVTVSTECTTPQRYGS